MFKYSKFDHYALQNLANKQVWCNHFEAFNDPFECWCIEKTGIPNPENERDRYNSIVSAWGYDPGPENINEFFEYCEEFDSINCMRISHYVDSARLTCFSQNRDNLLMWSHYADGLRGFCIEFEKEIFINLNQAGIYDIIYQDFPPIVDTMLHEVANDQVWYHEMVIDEEEIKANRFPQHQKDPLLPDYHIALNDARNLLQDLYFKMLCHKPLQWEYEKEVRLIFHSDSSEKTGEAFKYPKEAIKSIIIGEKASARIENYCTLHLGKSD